MVVSDDDGPDFVDELEAELAARRPVPVQQDEPRGWAATENFDPQTGDFLFGSDGQAYVCRNGGWHRYPERDRAATGTTEYSSAVPVQQDEPEGVCAFPNCSCTENRCPGVRASQDEPDDGYEVMCEPVAAMVEDVRAALVPVQQDEPEAFTTYLPWGIVKLDDVRAWVAENHPGYRFTSNNLCVGEGGERQCVRLVPVQQEPGR